MKIKGPDNAVKAWDSIPADAQNIVLNSVYCFNCKNVTTLINPIAAENTIDLVINGSCINCKNPVSRLIEIKLKKAKENKNESMEYVKLPSLYSIPKNAKIHKKLSKYPLLKIHDTGDWSVDFEVLCLDESDQEMLDIYSRVIKKGTRNSWEMEQVLPGDDPEDIDCPILKGIDLASTLGYDAGIRYFKSLVDEDPRCIDAYAHLGLFYFEQNNFSDTQKAKTYYKQGAYIGFSAIGVDRMHDVFLWGQIDNRPFLRCLEGYAFCLAREGKLQEALSVFEHMLLLNPHDNQGARFNIYDIKNGNSLDCT